MAYALAVADRTPEQRAEFDARLGVAGWPGPGTRRQVAPRPRGVPAWWHGDEEASAATLAAVGELRQRGRRRGR